MTDAFDRMLDAVKSGDNEAWLRAMQDMAGAK